MDEDVVAADRKSRSCDTEVVGVIDIEDVPGPSSSSSSGLTAKEKEIVPDTPRSPSPEPEVNKCAICLGDLVNKSYSNSCLHQFCFGCLLEWSKVKPECPLCKSVFRTIIHNIRTNSEFDEYVVPPPNPEESFNINSMAFANVLFPPRNPDSYFIGHHHHSNEDHGYSMLRPTRMDSRIEHPNPSRYIRILEMGTGISDAFDTFMHSISPHRYQHPNPFISDHPETFGSSLHLPNSSSSSSNQAGYQNRKRIYDRNTWISPFNSTLQPGSVFFPSIEYFRTHPMAIHRLTPWLHREIQVLLGLRLSQAELANVYSIIIDLIRRYDIRSSEFREFLKGYFGNHVRQFAHEFYHFVLSGMRIDEYDRTAVYPSPSTNNNQPSTSSSTVFEVERNPYDEPQVITISSSDSENEEDIIPTNLIRANSNSTNKKNEEIILIDSDSDDDNVQERRNREINEIERNLREAKDLHRDLLELLDVDVDIINDPDRSAPPTSTRNNNQEQSEIHDSSSNRYNSQDFLEASSLVREESTIDYPVDLSYRPAERRSVMARDHEHIRGANLANFNEAIKRLRYENENGDHDEGSPSSSHRSNSNPNRHERKKSELSEIIHTHTTSIERPPRPRSPSYPTPVISMYSSVPFPEGTSTLSYGWPTPTTTTYDFNRPATSSNIFVKTQNCNNNNPPNSSIGYTSVGYTTGAGPNNKDEAAGAEDSDSDICEYLGIHPIEKPPPLAIITISDSDEEKENEEKPSTSAAVLAELKTKLNNESESQEVKEKSDHQSESSDDSENDRPKYFTRNYKKINPKPKSERTEVTKNTSKAEKLKIQSESEPEHQSEAEGSDTDEINRPKRTRNYYKKIKNHSKSKPKKRKQKREKSDSDEAMKSDDDQVSTKKTSKSKRKRQKREIRSSDDDEDGIPEEIDKKGSKIELRPRPRKSKSPSKKKESSKSSSKSKKSKKSKKKKRRCYRQSSSSSCNSSSPPPHPPICTSTDTDED